MQDAPRPVRRARASRSGAPGADRPELQTGEPIDIYHWAAVALVTALMCAVLAYAAGTPALTRAANVTSVVFGAMGGRSCLQGSCASCAGSPPCASRKAIALTPGERARKTCSQDVQSRPIPV